MPKVKPETMAARRDGILDAAEICFARRGFHQTTIAEIIGESGLSAGCIYGHFPNKDDLIATVGERRHAGDAALLAAGDRTTDPLLALREIARAFLDDVQSKRGLRTRRVALELWAEALRNDAIRTQVTQGIRGPIAVLSELLLQGRRRGLVNEHVEPASTARAIVAMFQGFVLQRAWGEPFDATAALAAFDIFLAGLAPRRSPSRSPRANEKVRR